MGPLVKEKHRKSVSFSAPSVNHSRASSHQLGQRFPSETNFGAFSEDRQWRCGLSTGVKCRSPSANQKSLFLVSVVTP
ncbi:hypothetical protein AOLI_G00211110 [Acnodon oligacanthus]